MPTRIAFALERGGLAFPPEGSACVLRLPADAANAFDPMRTAVVHGFAPEAAAWTEAGFDVTPSIPESMPEQDMTVLGVPRAKLAARQLLARALRLTRPGGLIVVDGAKVDGVEPLLKLIRGTFGGVETLSKAHGKLIWFARPDTLPGIVSDWAQPDHVPPEGWQTVPGVFSAEAIDPGSALLAETLPPLKGRVCDLGAGWGYLSRTILAVPKVTHLDLVEAEFDALACARLNVCDDRAAFHWADARSFAPEARYDVIVTNPPFHAGQAATPALGQAFLHASARMLAPKGRLALVANRHLPYERGLERDFASVETVALTGAFKVIHASGPRVAT